jgi:uncharacterized protein
MIARECGLQPLADLLLADPTKEPAQAAEAFVKAAGPDGTGGVADVEAALEGARFILLEQFAEDAPLIGKVRKWLEDESLVRRLLEGKLALLRERAEAEAIRVFAANLRDLLLAAPAGPKAIDRPRSGPAHRRARSRSSTAPASCWRPTTIYPHVPKEDWDGSLRTLGLLCKQHGVNLISIGNGTASRETDKLAAELIKRHPELRCRSSSSARPAPRCTRRRNSPRRSSPSSTCRCAARCRSRAACRIRSPNWSRSTRRRSASASTSTTSTRRSSQKSLDAVVEDCVNASASTSTPRQRGAARARRRPVDHAGEEHRRAPRQHGPFRRARRC